MALDQLKEQVVSENPNLIVDKINSRLSDIDQQAAALAAEKAELSADLQTFVGAPVEEVSPVESIETVEAPAEEATETPSEETAEGGQG